MSGHEAKKRDAKKTICNKRLKKCLFQISADYFKTGCFIYRSINYNHVKVIKTHVILIGATHKQAQGQTAILWNILPSPPTLSLENKFKIHDFFSFSQTLKHITNLVCKKTWANKTALHCISRPTIYSMSQPLNFHRKCRLLFLKFRKF